jgi:hypothetical protein
MTSILYKIGDATAPDGDGPKMIVHVCNDRGGWGRGFVLALSRRWPEPEAAFRRWYAGRAANDFALGAVQFVPVEPDLWVANLVGQHGYRQEKGIPPVRYDRHRVGTRGSRGPGEGTWRVRPHAAHRLRAGRQRLGRGGSHC